MEENEKKEHTRKLYILEEYNNMMDDIDNSSINHVSIVASVSTIAIYMILAYVLSRISLDFVYVYKDFDSTRKLMGIDIRIICIFAITAISLFGVIATVIIHYFLRQLNAHFRYSIEDSMSSRKRVVDIALTEWSKE